MKRQLYLLNLSAMLVACGAPMTPNSNDTSGDPSSTSGEDETSYQMIFDHRFERGFSVSPGSGSNPDTLFVPDDHWPLDVDLVYGDADGKGISWIVSQHGDIYSLNDKYNAFAGGEPRFEDGYYYFEDESKILAPNPSKGALYMELNASHEYTRPRREGEQWCHLLLNQGFRKEVEMSDVESLDLHLNLNMKKFEDHMDGKVDSGLHAAQFLMYLIVKSNAPGDKNDFFWFGIPFFDNRYPRGVPEGGMVDAGGAGATSKFIYHMDGYDLLPHGLPVGETQEIDIDLKPYFGYALVKAQSMNYFTSSNVNDLVFQSMNIGFELPGTYDIGVEISDFTLTAEYQG